MKQLFPEILLKCCLNAQNEITCANFLITKLRLNVPSLQFQPVTEMES